MGKYFDPSELTKFSGMQIMAKTLVEGFLAGQHPSPKKGVSVDFAEHREYSYGDELKHLDWKVLGKTDKLFIKQYREETNLTSFILLDSSASMDYGSGKVTKFKYSVFLAAALSYLFVLQQDKSGLVVFDKEVRTLIPAKTGKAHLKTLMDNLDNLSPSNKTAIPEALKQASGLIKKKGILILISDLYGDEEAVRKYAKFLAAKKNDVIVFHVLDNEELNLTFKEPYIFEGMEDNDSILALPDLIRQEYKQIISKFTQSYKKEFESSNIDYVLLNTQTPVEEALLSYISRRARVLK